MRQAFRRQARQDRQERRRPLSAQYRQGYRVPFWPQAPWRPTGQQHSRPRCRRDDRRRLRDRYLPRLCRQAPQWQSGRVCLRSQAVFRQQLLQQPWQWSPLQRSARRRGDRESRTSCKSPSPRVRDGKRPSGCRNPRSAGSRCRPQRQWACPLSCQDRSRRGCARCRIPCAEWPWLPGRVFACPGPFACPPLSGGDWEGSRPQRHPRPCRGIRQRW